MFIPTSLIIILILCRACGDSLISTLVAIGIVYAIWFILYRAFIFIVWFFL